jgi:uncharacterized membrane protein YvbJ
MKKSLFLYLFIIAVLMNVFTYKYFTSKEAATKKTETALDSQKGNDSITKLTDKLYDANYFSLESNDRAMNYLNQNDINAFAEKVKQALLAYNDDKAGNKYTDQVTMGEQKFIINKVKLLNHRWIIADFSNGKLWGEVMLKYFINDDQTVSFEVMNTYLYPEQLN